MTEPVLSAMTTSISARRSPFERIADLWQHRELIANLVRRELKTKYRDSVLGFIWTLLNPLLYLVVFSLVFTGLLRSGVPRFGIYLLSGLVCWNLFSGALLDATGSIVANGPLVQKIRFPRDVLPLASVGAAIVNFGFQLIVLTAGLVVLRHEPEWSMIWLLVPAVLVTILLATALGIVLSAVNVYLRDVQHLLESVLLAGFWLTPIVYQYDLVTENASAEFGSSFAWIGLLNPMSSVVVTFQRVLYNPTRLPAGSAGAEAFESLDQPALWYLRNLGIVGGIAIVFIFIALIVFDRLDADLGEEI